MGLGMLAIPAVGTVVRGRLARGHRRWRGRGRRCRRPGRLLRQGRHDEDEANYYAETVRRGGSVVSVRAEPEHKATVEAILDGATPIDRDTRMAEYRKDGWTRFDEKTGPYMRGTAGI